MERKMVGVTKENQRRKQLQMHNNESAGDQKKKEKKSENYGRKLIRDDASGDVRKIIKMQNRAHLVDRSQLPHLSSCLSANFQLSVVLIGPANKQSLRSPSDPPGVVQREDLMQ